LRNPIRSSDAKSTRTAPRRQPLFSKIFHFLSNPLILLVEIDADFSEFRWRTPQKTAGAEPMGPSAGPFFRASRAVSCFFWSMDKVNAPLAE
jgi:hypothetical protein